MELPSGRLCFDVIATLALLYAANVFDPAGYSIEFVYKSWQQAKKSEASGLT